MQEPSLLSQVSIQIAYLNGTNLTLKLNFPPQSVFSRKGEGEGEGEVAFFSAKRWDRRNRADLIESATPCHDALVVGPYRDSNPLRLTVLAAMSGDYTTAPQHLQKKKDLEKDLVSYSSNL